MEQGLARRAFWALHRCPGRKQPELLSGSKCVAKLSEEKEEVAWGEKQEPWCYTDLGLCPAILTSKGGSIGYPLSAVFFFFCPMSMVAPASQGDLNSMTVMFCKGVSMTNKNNGFI